MAKLKSTLRLLLPISSLLLLWQILSSFGILNPQFLPSPVNVGRALVDLLINQNLLVDIVASLKRVLIGFLIATVLGIGIGLYAGFHRAAASFVTPLVELFRPIPPIAWIPLAILWFGLGDTPAYFLVFLGAFFPIFTNVLFGVMAVEETYKRAAYSLGATKKHFVTDILIPASLPHIFAGMRIGLGVGWIVVITAELVGAQSGLGYMIQFNRLLLETPKVIVGMVVIGVIGFLLNRLMVQLEHQLVPWKKNRAKFTRMKVKFQNVSKSFNGRNNSSAIDVLDNVSFEVKESEFFCIVGPSGCGKSTIINLAAGFFPPNSGGVSVDGKTISEPSASRTVVFQEYALFPWKTAAENIEFGLKCANVEKEQRLQMVKKLAGKVRLEQFLDRYPDELSGGMKQRVAIARAFAVKPNIILMDEPFASLDQQTRDILQEELLGFQNELSQTILFVTHNVEEALFLGDKVLVLSHRPARIKSLINIPFSKPRSPDIRNGPQFLKLKHEIWHALREEVI